MSEAKGREWRHGGGEGVSSKTEWVRYRFRANGGDPRPVAFPPPGPYWVSGYSDRWAIIVAFLPRGIRPRQYWPEAREIDGEAVEEIIFYDRFPRPSWWDGEGREYENGRA